MFDTTDTRDLEAQHQAVLAALPIPMVPTCVRAVLRTTARDHIYAEAHRKSGQAQHRLRHNRRGNRLHRTALRTEALAAELLAEVR
ncbi:hypothetical protein [Marilutibacter aestuarii]|uniref:Uncharacterized protein n=1 Tax=Marilutibacter aestuarii TaxID=1706195 RepID=A0A508AP33_9GAMM|nr:hypothetical protein [Lysobacter aestuarii]TQD51217.1 hypothetical protein FKV25_01940 [Lysobacter aestuarii]